MLILAFVFAVSAHPAKPHKPAKKAFVQKKKKKKQKYYVGNIALDGVESSVIREAWADALEGPPKPMRFIP